MSRSDAEILYSSSTTTASSNYSFHSFVLQANELGIELSASCRQLFNAWVHLVEPRVIFEYILPETALAPRPSIRYANAIIKRIAAAGLHSLEEIRAADQAREARRVNQQANYKQRTYPERPADQMPEWLAEMLAAEK